MDLTEKQIELLIRKNLIVLATSDLENNPRAIIVEVKRIDENKIVIADNEMEVTRNNLLSNRKVFLLAYEEDYSYCLKISGEIEYQTEGEFFDFVKTSKSNEGYNLKGIVVVTIKDIVEFK